VGVEEAAERPQQLGLDLQHGAVARGAHRDVAVLEQGVGVGVVVDLGHLDGRWGGGGGDRPQRRGAHLDPTGRVRVGHDLARHLDARLVQGRAHALEDALHDPAAVAQVEEGQAAEVAAVVDPAAQQDRLAEALGEVGDQRAPGVEVEAGRSRGR
jgi:hypothetical protein